MQKIAMTIICLGFAGFAGLKDLEPVIEGKAEKSRVPIVIRVIAFLHRCSAAEQGTNLMT